MTQILALLQNIAPLIEKTTLRHMSQVIFGMLAASGRITMLGLSRWTEKGGSYRTIQRFYHTVLPWKALQWLFFQKRFLKPEDEYILAGDEVVVSKAGKETYGLDRFFSGLQQRIIPSLSFFAFSLVNVREEQSYPLQATQIVKSAAEKAASKTKAEAKKVKKTAEKKKPQVALEQVVAAKALERFLLLPVAPGQDLVHGRLQIVVCQPPGNATQKAKGLVVPLEKSFLFLEWKCHHETRFRVVQAQDEQLHRHPFSSQDHLRLTPVHLSILPRIELQRNVFLLVLVFPPLPAYMVVHRSFAARIPFTAQYLEDAMRRIALLPLLLFAPCQ